MPITRLLSSQLGQKGNDANIALARQIADANNTEALKVLVENLNNKDKKIQSDCIKTIYETGYIKPELIADYCNTYLSLLPNKNNRLVWGAMVALASITLIKPKEIFAEFELIKTTIEKGSVITVDCGIEILAKLNTIPDYTNTIEPFLTEQLWKCPIKQLPQYMEKTVQCIQKHNKELYLEIVTKRLPECEKESQKKRLAKVRALIEKK